MIDSFKAWVAFQEQMIEVQRAQLEAAQRVVDLGGDISKAQKAATDAVKANMKAWQGWLELWTPAK